MWEKILAVLIFLAFVIIITGMWKKVVKKEEIEGIEKEVKEIKEKIFGEEQEKSKEK